MLYPKELWEVKNAELYGDGGDVDEAIVRYCAKVCSRLGVTHDQSGYDLSKDILEEFGLDVSEG
jgi:hypothetical protein